MHLNDWVGHVVETVTRKFWNNWNRELAEVRRSFLLKLGHKHANTRGMAKREIYSGFSQVYFAFLIFQVISLTFNWLMLVN